MEIDVIADFVKFRKTKASGKSSRERILYVYMPLINESKEKFGGGRSNLVPHPLNKVVILLTPIKIEVMKNGKMRLGRKKL